MDVNGEERVRAKRLGDKVDRLSNLPESLLLHVLLNLPTKDVVRCSVLSSRWRNLWKFVPGLDLDMDYCDFGEYDKFVSFVDGFLGFNSESCIQNFKLSFRFNKDNEPDIARIAWWINNVVDRKVQHLCVSNSRDSDAQVQIPPTVYTCESLVSLELDHVILANPEFVSLPSVKVINLYTVQFANDLAFKMLISGCPVLKSLTIRRDYFDNVQVFLVCSHSLLSFTFSSEIEDYELDFDREVAIDAPRLEYLELDDHETDSFVINNSPSLVKADINIFYKMNDPKERIMVHNFLVRISSVKEMDISTHTLERLSMIIQDMDRYPFFLTYRSWMFTAMTTSWKCC